MSRPWLAHIRALSVLFAWLLISQHLYGQSLTGRWSTYGRELWNGQREISVFDLSQTGGAINGTFESLTGKTKVKGTITGSHFEIFAWDPNKPSIVGDLVDGELRGTLFGRPFVARPTTPADEIPKVAYIEPPSLHPVPYNGLAKTPPMGWNSWNFFGEQVTEADIRNAADVIVSSGMRDAGYVYVNIDGTWQGGRDAQGNLQPNKKFSDMKALADYVHSKGLKIGIYSSPGPYDCAGYPSSYGHEQEDARMFASWGIDYLKYDWCSAEKIYPDDAIRAVYQKMGDALAATGRPIVFSLCEYGRAHVEQWGAEVGGNLWRTTDDIRDSWDSMMANLGNQAHTAPFAGPGHWNDPDMLQIGNGGMTTEEYRTQMSIWALVAAPLLAGNNLPKMSETTRSILLNEEVIAVDQDSLGKQASPIRQGDLQTWIKPLSDGGVAVGVVNLGKSPAMATIDFKDLPLRATVSHARNLWTHEEVKFNKGKYSAEVAPHATLLLRISASEVPVK